MTSEEVRPEISDTEWLYLFTSNMRPLYEQDAVDLLAEPSGFHYRFRYQRQYLADDLVDQWETNQLVGRLVLACFSIQQQENYHPSAFIPLRYGRVLSTHSEGSLYVVQFGTGSWVSLASAEGQNRGERVQQFSRSLKDHLPATPDDKKSAVLGPQTAGLIDDSNDMSPWEISVDYLSRTLSFADCVFIRYSSLREIGDQAEDVLPGSDGVVQLEAGRTYELRVTHMRPLHSGSTPKYEVVSDEDIVSVVDGAEFTIASRYDTVPIVIHALARTDTRETMLAVRPAEGGRGAALRLRLRVSPSTKEQVLGVGGTAASLLAVASPGILTIGAGWEIAIAGVGVLLGAVLVQRGLKRA